MKIDLTETEIDDVGAMLIAYVMVCHRYIQRSQDPELTAKWQERWEKSVAVAASFAMAFVKAQNKAKEEKEPAQ